VLRTSRGGGFGFAERSPAELAGSAGERSAEHNISPSKMRSILLGS